MNFKKILASTAAAALAVSAMSVVASANTVFSGDFDLDIVVIADEGLTWKLDLAAEGVLDENVKVEDVYGATIKFTQESHDTYVSENAGMGGALVFSGSGSAKNWNAIEWGNSAANKPITYDDETRTITRLDDAPFFDETDISGEEDTKAFICLQGYWGPENLEVESIALLGKDGSVLKTFPGDYVAPSDGDSASSVTYNVDTQLAVLSQDDWSTAKSDVVTITGPGTYTYSLDGLSVNKIGSVYIKDATAIDSDPAAGYASDISDYEIEWTSVKMNGEELTVDAEGFKANAEYKDVFDFSVVNAWDNNYVEAVPSPLKSVEITITVKSVADAAEDPEATEPEETKPEETEAEQPGNGGFDIPLDPEETENTQPEPEATTPAETEPTTPSDGGEPNPPTGAAFLLIPVAAAVAGVAASRKRK